MRELVYYVAATLDGFIAQTDGSFDGFPWDDDFGTALFAAFPETFPGHLRPDRAAPAGNRAFDTVLMGRKTYEVGLAEGITDPYPTLTSYVFSTTMSSSPDPRVTLVGGEAEDRVRQLKEEPGLAVWLCGGATLAGRLVRAGLVDRLVVKLNPVVFGSGIPLFHGVNTPFSLDLQDSQAFGSGHMILTYAVGGT